MMIAEMSTHLVSSLGDTALQKRQNYDEEKKQCDLSKPREKNSCFTYSTRIHRYTRFRIEIHANISRGNDSCY